ncbi:MAG: MarR family transcriptional regulator [Anaerolineae bacterium]|nr:MarR family transcriptional regulator [Anaerolineae bacterium]
MSKDHPTRDHYRKFLPSGLEQHHRDLLRRYFGEGESVWMETFRSLMKVSNMVQALSEKGLDKHGMSMAKIRMLFMLLMRDEEGMLPSELSRLQGVMPNTISSLIASLREAGMIAQVAHPSDRRKRIIKITDAGRAMLTDLGPHQRNFVQMMFENFSDDEVHQFSLLINKLIGNVQGLLCKEGDDSKDKEVTTTQPDQQPS